MEPTNLNVIQHADDGEEALNHQVDQVLSQVDRLEQSVINIEKFYSKNNKKQPSNSKGSWGVKDNEKNKHAASTKRQQDLAHMNTVAGERMQDLNHQFDTIICQEKRLQTEGAETRLKGQQAKEAAHAKMAQDVSNKLYETHMHLEELRQTVLQKCRKMSTDEKRRLGTALTHLSTEDISKALEIISESEPAFETAAEEVDLDIDALSEYTLWRLMFFVKDALRAHDGLS